MVTREAGAYSLVWPIRGCASTHSIASPQTSFRVRSSHMGEKWMRDERTIKEICGEARHSIVRVQSLDTLDTNELLLKGI